MPKTPGTTFRFGKDLIAVLKEAAAIDDVTMTAWVHDAITDKLRNDAEWYAVPLEMMRGTSAAQPCETCHGARVVTFQYTADPESARTVPCPDCTEEAQNEAD